jgi:hypothetical protein
MIGRRTFLKGLGALLLAPKGAVKALSSLTVDTKFPFVHKEFALGFIITRDIIDDDAYDSARSISKALAKQQNAMIEARAMEIMEYDSFTTKI